MLLIRSGMVVNSGEGLIPFSTAMSFFVLLLEKRVKLNKDTNTKKYFLDYRGCEENV